VVQHERQNELFDESERVEIAVPANLIEQDLLVVAQESSALTRASESGMKGLGKIESLVASDNVFDSPVCFDRSCQRLPVVVGGCNHRSSIQFVCSNHCGLPRYN
jgi:hypothetical protein